MVIMRCEWRQDRFARKVRNEQAWSLRFPTGSQLFPERMGEREFKELTTSAGKFNTILSAATTLAY
jgi:hypothetical protein